MSCLALGKLRLAEVLLQAGASVGEWAGETDMHTRHEWWRALHLSSTNACHSMAPRAESRDHDRTPVLKYAFLCTGAEERRAGEAQEADRAAR